MSFQYTGPAKGLFDPTANAIALQSEALLPIEAARATYEFAHSMIS